MNKMDINALSQNTGNLVKEQPKTIEVEGLTKAFGNVIALNDISFSVLRGEIFGFLGPNGAGKTTTINILTGLARPDGGKIRIADINCIGCPKAAQHLIGVVPDESNLYPELSGFENLCFCASLYGIAKQTREQKARNLLNTFGLAHAADRKFGSYSRGMKRKLTIAAGIIHEPSILFLDEPTTGIDVASARQIRQLIVDLNRDGTTIFLTTHYIEEAERLCHRIAFIVSGRIVHVDTLEMLMQNSHKHNVLEFVVNNGTSALASEVTKTFAQIGCKEVAKGVFRISSDQKILIGPLVRFFEQKGFEVAEVRKVRRTLEDVFVQITGLEAEAMKTDKEKTGGGK